MTALTTFIPVRIKRHGGRKVVIPAAAGDKRCADPDGTVQGVSLATVDR